jgi:hypothetical protein
MLLKQLEDIEPERTANILSVIKAYEEGIIALEDRPSPFHAIVFYAGQQLSGWINFYDYELRQHYMNLIVRMKEDGIMGFTWIEDVSL